MEWGTVWSVVGQITSNPGSGVASKYHAMVYTCCAIQRAAWTSPHAHQAAAEGEHSYQQQLNLHGGYRSVERPTTPHPHTH